MRIIGNNIIDVLEHHDDEGFLERTRAEIVALCARFPIYPELRL